ncbi:hypothetical protein D3C85_1644620 [compost metagenome]
MRKVAGIVVVRKRLHAPFGGIEHAAAGLAAGGVKAGDPGVARGGRDHVGDLVALTDDRIGRGRFVDHSFEHFKARVLGRWLRLGRGAAGGEGERQG